MKASITSLLALLITVSSALAQENTISVPYLENPPAIDGLPDTATNAIRWRDFAYTEKSDEHNQDVEVRYKLAYGYTFLYLIIESKSESIIHRDRAYQNGDGFHMVIAKPEASMPTDEFYVLRFSPADTSQNIPAGKNEWYYNIGLSWKSLSSWSKFACCSSGGRSYFELLLSWDDVYPYHPFFSDSIGVNLCFVKAIGKSEKNYYYLKYDDKIQSELSKRKYLYAVFENPEREMAPFTRAQLSRRNIETGQPLSVRVFSSSPTKKHASYIFTLSSADDHVYQATRKEVSLGAGSNNMRFQLPTERLTPGGYVVSWRSSDNSSGRISLSVLPQLNLEMEKRVLDRSRNKTTTGSYNTLLFILDDIFEEYGNLKPYETAGDVREDYSSYRQLIAELKDGNDVLAHRTGLFRRAFRSHIDSTLQPYTVRIPDDYTSERTYPLLVMLHGSGSDDRDILTGTALSEGDFIEVAPYGRGTSNCFTTDGAEVDVKEAIDDVIRNYSIDTSKMVTAGFSMGGYGAYRIFYEYPHLFKGVAVFSGNPSLATRWIGEGFPDFLQEKYLRPFGGIPVFIYHSKNDLNCPYYLTEQLVTKLKSIGARVEFVTTEEGGHGIIEKDKIGMYYEWLRHTVK